LALVHELIKLHGGQMTAQSVSGKGTTFTIRLPAGSDHLPVERVETAEPLSPLAELSSSFVEEAWRWLPEGQDDYDRAGSPQRGTTTSTRINDSAEDRPRVIVADDNADMRRYLVHLLSSRFRAEGFPDGEAALAAARETPPTSS